MAVRNHSSGSVGWSLDVVKTATGERETNLVGYCPGGTLLAATLAYLAGKGDTRAVSATYFATLVDFTDVGDMAVFIDEEQLKELEARMRDRGYLEAHEMAMSFNMLRANDARQEIEDEPLTALSDAGKTAEQLHGIREADLRVFRIRHDQGLT